MQPSHSSLAVGQTVILLRAPLSLVGVFNRDKNGVPSTWQNSRQRLLQPVLGEQPAQRLHRQRVQVDLLLGHCCGDAAEAELAVDETVIPLHPPLPLVGVSIAMERERQQNDSLVNG